ncbi:MAG: hypothetical protein WC878_01700 [Candidatus Paceibacterota bacterium]|jgi:hypothetical protein
MCDESNIILTLEPVNQETDDSRDISRAEFIEKQLAELLERGSGPASAGDICAAMEDEEETDIEEDEEETEGEEEDDIQNLSHAELVERQLAEIIGEDNRRYARHALGREPSLGDLVVHYAQNGGPEDFQRRHGKPTCIVRIDFYD